MFSHYYFISTVWFSVVRSDEIRVQASQWVACLKHQIIFERLAAQVLNSRIQDTRYLLCSRVNGIADSRRHRRRLTHAEPSVIQNAYRNKRFRRRVRTLLQSVGNFHASRTRRGVDACRRRSIGGWSGEGARNLNHAGSPEVLAYAFHGIREKTYARAIFVSINQFRRRRFGESSRTGQITCTLFSTAFGWTVATIRKSIRDFCLSTL